MNTHHLHHFCSSYIDAFIISRSLLIDTSNAQIHSVTMQKPLSISAQKRTRITDKMSINVELRLYMSSLGKPCFKKCFIR